jgi:hypothetical protein
MRGIVFGTILSLTILFATISAAFPSLSLRDLLALGFSGWAGIDEREAAVALGHALNRC